MAQGADAALFEPAVGPVLYGDGQRFARVRALAVDHLDGKLESTHALAETVDRTVCFQREAIRQRTRDDGPMVGGLTAAGLKTVGIGPDSPGIAAIERFVPNVRPFDVTDRQDIGRQAAPLSGRIGHRIRRRQRLGVHRQRGTVTHHGVEHPRYFLSFRVRHAGVEPQIGHAGVLGNFDAVGVGVRGVVMSDFQQDSVPALLEQHRLFSLVPVDFLRLDIPAHFLLVDEQPIGAAGAKTEFHRASLRGEHTGGGIDILVSGVYPLANGVITEQILVIVVVPVPETVVEVFPFHALKGGLNPGNGRPDFDRQGEGPANQPVVDERRLRLRLASRPGFGGQQPEARQRRNGNKEVCRSHFLV